MKRKPHKKWDCPCTDCQAWYRAEVARLRAALEKIDADGCVTQSESGKSCRAVYGKDDFRCGGCIAREALEGRT